MIQPKVPFHPAVLKTAGLVKDRKQGKWMHYRIDDTDLVGLINVALCYRRKCYSDQSCTVTRI